MSGRELDAFLLELQALDADSPDTAGLGLAALAETLEPVAPSAERRAQLMAAVPAQGRYERFAAQVAELLDVGLERARALLDKLDDVSLFSEELPGIALCWLEGGPGTSNAVRGFVRVAAGTRFPEHAHLGEEKVLVLQGSYFDPACGRAFRPGDLAVMPPGTAHDYVVPADGPDLVMLSVTQVGLRIGEQLYHPR
jgi:quercetin dioxygenase-like cupin family protein